MSSRNNKIEVTGRKQNFSEIHITLKSMKLIQAFSEKQYTSRMKSFPYVAHKRTEKVLGLKGPECHLEASNCHKPKAARLGLSE